MFNIKRSCLLFSVLLLLCRGAFAAVAEDAEHVVPDFDSGRDVVGKGRASGHAPDVEEIDSLLRRAESAISQHKLESAIEICQSGLDALGDAYWSKNILDDTDMKLIAANMLRKDGKLENAAAMYCRLLSTRLHLYIKKIQ